MSIILFIVVLVVSFALGTIGFAQIFGSLQNIQYRPSLLGTMILWIAILVAGFFLAKKIVPSEMLGLYIGYGVSFVIMLGQGKIE